MLVSLVTFDADVPKHELSIALTAPLAGLQVLEQLHRRRPAIGSGNVPSRPRGFEVQASDLPILAVLIAAWKHPLLLYQVTPNERLLGTCTLYP